MTNAEIKELCKNYNSVSDQIGGLAQKMWTHDPKLANETAKLRDNLAALSDRLKEELLPVWQVHYRNLLVTGDGAVRLVEARNPILALSEFASQMREYNGRQIEITVKPWI